MMEEKIKVLLGTLNDLKENAGVGWPTILEYEELSELINIAESVLLNVSNSDNETQQEKAFIQ
jgi:hypothetical protein